MPCGGLPPSAWLLALASAVTSLQGPARRGPVRGPRKDSPRASSRHAHARAVAREGFGSKPRPTEASQRLEAAGRWWVRTANGGRASTTGRKLLHSLLVCLTIEAGVDEAPSKGAKVLVDWSTWQPGSALPGCRSTARALHCSVLWCVRVCTCVLLAALGPNQGRHWNIAVLRRRGGTDGHEPWKADEC